MCFFQLRVSQEAERRESRRSAVRRRRGRLAVWFLSTTAVILVLCMWYLSREVATYAVTSASMEPTLHCASGTGCASIVPDHFAVDRLIYSVTDPARFDIAAFAPPPSAPGNCEPAKVYVKRIIGLPGESVSQVDGSLRVNGLAIPDRHANRRSGSGDDFSAVYVPPRSYFVMGDNRGMSCDSRAFGVIRRRDLIGRLLLIYSPSDRIRFLSFP